MYSNKILTNETSCTWKEDWSRHAKQRLGVGKREFSIIQRFNQPQRARIHFTFLSSLPCVVKCPRRVWRRSIVIHGYPRGTRWRIKEEWKLYTIRGKGRDVARVASGWVAPRLHIPLCIQTTRSSMDYKLPPERELRPPDSPRESGHRLLSRGRRAIYGTIFAMAF